MVGALWSKHLQVLVMMMIMVSLTSLLLWLTKDNDNFCRQFYPWCDIAHGSPNVCMYAGWIKMSSEISWQLPPSLTSQSVQSLSGPTFMSPPCPSKYWELLTSMEFWCHACFFRSIGWPLINLIDQVVRRGDYKSAKMALWSLGNESNWPFPVRRRS